MIPNIFLVILLAENAVIGQELSFNFAGLLRGRGLYEDLGGAWLKSVTGAQNRRVYNSLVSTTVTQEKPGLLAGSDRLSFQVHPVCNYSSCCSSRTSISIARRSAVSATRLGVTGPPPLLACGPSPADPGAVPAPCHPPLADQPVLQAFQTRVQLSIHTLRRTLLQLGVSAAAALSTSGVLSPPAWITQLPVVRIQRQKLLALPPSDSAQIGMFNPTQNQQPVNADESAGHDAANAPDTELEVMADEESSTVEDPYAAPDASHGWGLVAPAPAAEGASAASGALAPDHTGTSADGLGGTADSVPSWLNGCSEGGASNEDDYPRVAHQRSAEGTIAPARPAQIVDVAPEEPALGMEPLRPWPGADAAPPLAAFNSVALHAGDNTVAQEIELMTASSKWLERAASQRVADQHDREDMGAVVADAVKDMTFAPSRPAAEGGIQQNGAEGSDMGGKPAALLETEAEAEMQCDERLIAVAAESQAATAPPPAAEAQGVGTRDGATAAPHICLASPSNKVCASHAHSLEQPAQLSELATTEAKIADADAVDVGAADDDDSRSMLRTEPRPFEETAPEATIIPDERIRAAADLITKRSLSRQRFMPSVHALAISGSAVAVLFTFLLGLALWAARRRAHSLSAALENARQDHARDLEHLHIQHETLVSELFCTKEDLEIQLAEARADVERQRAARRSAVRAVAVSARERTTATVQLAQQVAEMQMAQAELTGTLASAVREWRARGQVLTASLRRCRRRAETVAQMAAVERVAAEGRRRLQVEAAERVAVADRLRHAQDMAQLRQRLEEELVAERQRHSATVAAARKDRTLYEVAMGELRRRQGRNLAAWLALRSWLGLQVEVLSERAEKMAAEHTTVLAEARSVVEHHELRVATIQQQLAEQVAVVVESHRTNGELTHLLGHKDRSILGLEAELAATNAALESQRRQRDDLQQALTTTEESLGARKRDLTELKAQLRTARAAAQGAEARVERLEAANALLEQQVSEFTNTMEIITAMEESHLAPARAKVAALEEQIAEEREAAAAAVAEREAKLAEAAAELSEARREVEAAQRARNDLAKKMEDLMLELQATQAELSRLEEGSVASGAMVFAPKQPSGRDQHHGDHRERDQEAVMQQLLGALTGRPLTLPADPKTLTAAASPVSVSTAAAGGGVLPVADRGAGGGSGSGARGAAALTFGSTSGLRK